MFTYILRRLLAAVAVMWGAATAVFFALRLLPGDPVEAMLAEAGGTPEAMARVRAELGIDLPVPVQYLHFLSRVLQGDLGRSLFSGRPVVQTLLEQLPSTLELATAAMAIALLLGGTLGVLAAVWRGSWLDRGTMVLAVGGVSMPVFWSGLLAIWLFSVQLGWLPAAGQGGLRHLILPAAVLGLGGSGSLARLVRASLVEVLSRDYIRVARAKGLRGETVLFRHALRNALIPAITLIGLQFGFLLGGTVVTETVFSRQGLGRLLVEAIIWKDFPLVQGAILLTAGVYAVLNLVVDLSYLLLDPRLRGWGD
jgi:ABC-type dipeptide/oligopeptide/nickel transport system permease component